MPGEYSCNCWPGWTGKQCDIDIKECQDNDPCSATISGQKLGVCFEPKVGVWECLCPIGIALDSSTKQCSIDVDECDSFPCQNHGTCIKSDDINNLNYFECNCRTGYTGKLCETDINECSSNPCKNKGICYEFQNDQEHSHSAGYYCNCQSTGFTGTNCETEINECDSNPCKNGGTCTDTNQGFTCQCPDGFALPNCAVNINECKSSPCHHGSCEDQVFGLVCNCDEGFTGDRCDIEIDECLSNPCGNPSLDHDSYCHNGPKYGEFYCQCITGLKRKINLPYDNCDEDIDECSSNPCQNQGTCLQTKKNFPTLNFYSCNCPKGLTGTNCEIDIDECHSYPCINGVCVNLFGKDLGSYQCTDCVGYTGLNCEIEINECESNPCVFGTCLESDVAGEFKCRCYNGVEQTELCDQDFDECSSSPCKFGSICNLDLSSESSMNTFTCDCVEGTTGIFCETDINECSSNPCRSYGYCNDQLGKYVCDCLPGFTGINCESDINECNSNPCLYSDLGSSCTNYIASIDNEDEDFRPNFYKCNCPTGLTGVNCEINIDECASFPCAYGRCMDGLDYWECFCMDGFYGIHCDSDTNECESSPCEPFGKCYQGWSGTYILRFWEFYTFVVIFFISRSI